jgi:E3 ubiquitin-protein ligase UBR2
MNVSAGGGYCDCGDSEAWKQYVHCNLHIPHDDNNESADDILKRLPSDLRLRAKQLFHILLHFIIKLLCTENCQTIPNELKNEYELFVETYEFEFRSVCIVLAKDFCDTRK